MIRESSRIWSSQNEPNAEKTVVLRLLNAAMRTIHSSSTSDQASIGLVLGKITRDG